MYKTNKIPGNLSTHRIIIFKTSIPLHLSNSISIIKSSLDENYNAWLIEVNSSPTMEYSTGVTKVLAQNVMESIVKVVSDYTFSNKNIKKKSVDTGDFVMIYKGKNITKKD